MSRRHVVAGTLAIAAFCAGCKSNTTAHSRFSGNPNPCEQPKVTVRFVSQPGVELAAVEYNQPGTQMAANDHAQPTYAQPAYAQPAYVEPAYVEPAYAEPAWAEPTPVQQPYAQPTHAEPTVELVADPVVSDSAVADPQASGNSTQPQPQAQTGTGRPGTCKFTSLFNCSNRNRHSHQTANTNSGNTYSGNTNSGSTYSGNTYAGNTYSGDTNSGNTYSGNTNSGNTYTGKTYSRTNNTGEVVYPCNTGVAGGTVSGVEVVPQHAVLWGPGYNGRDVTYYPTQLDAGSYTFAYFDPERGAAYQGWIAVNNGGDDVLGALTEWRDTVHRQEEWLAFEYKTTGKFTSRNHEDFTRFNTQLANLRRLEGKLNKAICAEQQDRQQMSSWYNQYLGKTQVVLMPGSGSPMGQSATLPAFQPADLSTVQGGQPVTKVIVAGDFARSMEKIDRLADLKDEMHRCRVVLAEEISRLENRRHYFRLTAHLYDHDENFVANEQRVQQARGLLGHLDRQITENRRHAHAVLAVVGLFAPEEAGLAFDQEQADIRSERAILAERLRQVEIQYNDASTWSEKRIALETQRQFLLGQMAECDLQLDQCDQAADVVAQLRQNTGVIYRNGPASVLAASFINDAVPARLAHAIEKESLMTIRLHPASGIRASANHLTEGEVIREQTFIQTNYQPAGNQYDFQLP